MQFSSLNEFIAMGGHGFYVWLSYSVSLLLLVILLINSVQSNKKIKLNIKKKLKRDEKLKAALLKQAQAEQEIEDTGF